MSKIQRSDLHAAFKAPEEGNSSLERGIDFGLDPALVDEHAMHAGSIIQVGQSIVPSELDHCVQAGRRRVLQDHITARGSSESKATLICQTERAYDLTILHRLQLELRPASRSSYCLSFAISSP